MAGCIAVLGLFNENNMTRLYMDTETFSEVNLKTAGTINYADNAEVMILTFAIGDEGKVYGVDYTRGQKTPERLLDEVHSPNNDLVFHNSFFDRHIINRTNLFGMQIKTDRVIDTMAVALAHGLPAGLGPLGAAFGLDEDNAKDKDGMRLIQLFCKPKGKKLKDGRIVRATYDTNPEDWVKFMRYAKQDVHTMRKLYLLLPKWNARGQERLIWELDQKINDRGIQIDVELCRKAMEEAVFAKKELGKLTQAATDGQVMNATQRAVLLNFLNTEYDLNLTDLKADTVDRRLAQTGLPSHIRELLELRSDASKNAASKYKRALENASYKDGRFRGALQYCGASRTGRWAGRVVQPQNMRRPTMKTHEIEEATESILDGTFSNRYIDRRMDVLGNCVRGLIIAKPGRKLVVSDLSNIEGRSLIWLSGEDWKLKYFREYDAGKVEYDNYVVAYKEAMNCDFDTAKDNRQIGKVMELGLGYGGGVAAFITFAAVYRLDLDELADRVWEAADHDHLMECYGKYEWAKKNGYHAGLDQEVYAACELLKQKWRAAHPRTVEFWQNLEDCFRLAIKYEGRTFTVRGCPMLKMRRDKNWLRVKLPSGRYLVYVNPWVDEKKNIWFRGVDQLTRRWAKIHTYSGKLSENVTSATSRDVMAYNFPKIEEAGYPIALSVHDEVITEPRDKRSYSADKLSALLSAPHEWSKGLPLAAQGFETYRYRKD